MSPLELKEYIDFDVKRMYFITAPLGDKLTGAHCHLEEEELFILAKGTATLVVDYGNGLEEIAMEGPTSAVYVPSWVWHHFKDLSDDSVLIALSSTNYNPDRVDYVEDYEQYLKERPAEMSQ